MTEVLASQSFNMTRQCMTTPKKRPPRPESRNTCKKRCTPSVPLQTVQTTPSSVVSHQRAISAADITQRIRSLFEQRVPQEPINAVGVPCVSARLFALYTLVAEQSLSDTPSRNTRRSQVSQSLGPTETFLRAWVVSEAISLADSAPEPQGRLIHFSGYDVSAMKPPIDRVEGSESHLYDCIDALAKLKSEIDGIIMSENKKAARACLSQLIAFLRDLSEDATMRPLVDACALSIDKSYRAERILKAANFFRQDIQLLVNRIDVGFMTPKANDQFMKVEKRFAELTGQAIRHMLRYVLNDTPPRLCKEDAAYETRKKHFSKVARHVKMTMPSDASNSAVDDECMSALVSLALLRMLECLSESLFDPSVQQPLVPVQFCTKPASNKAWKGRRVDDMTQEEKEEIVADVADGFAFLAATRACRFLVDLLEIPGVQSEIRRRGGWTAVETYATYSWRYSLWRVCPDDAHLVVLSNCTAFFEKIKAFVTVMEGLVPTCEESLAALENRFPLSTLKPSNKNYEYFQEIAVCLQEWRERASAFPLIEINQDPFNDETDVESTTTVDEE